MLVLAWICVTIFVAATLAFLGAVAYHAWQDQSTRRDMIIVVAVTTILASDAWGIAYIGTH